MGRSHIPLFARSAALAVAVVCAFALSLAHASDLRISELIRKQGAYLSTDSKSVLNVVSKEAVQRNILINKPEWLSIYNSISIEYIDIMLPNAYAIIEDEGNKIYFSSGILVFTDLYVMHAVLLIDYKDRINGICGNYIKYLVDSIRSSSDMDSSTFLRSIETPWDYCGTPELNGDIEYAKKIVTLGRETMQSVVGIVLSHEYAHHFLRHLPPKKVSPSKSRKIEWEADRLASNLMGNSISRTPGIIVFTLFANLRTRHPFDILRTRDAAECRFIFFMLQDQYYWRGYQGEMLTIFKNRTDIAPIYKSYLDLIIRGDTKKLQIRCDQ